MVFRRPVKAVHFKRLFFNIVKSVFCMCNSGVARGEDEGAEGAPEMLRKLKNYFNGLRKVARKVLNFI